MRNIKKETIRLIGEPARFTQQKMAGRRPIWIACWGVLWTLVVWDVYLSLDAIDGNTWSEIMRGASVRNPVFPWLFGAFLTHLFHFQDDLKSIFDQDASTTVMVVLTLVIGAIGIRGVELTDWWVTFVFFLGMVAGLLLWPKLRQAEWYW